MYVVVSGYEPPSSMMIHRLLQMRTVLLPQRYLAPLRVVDIDMEAGRWFFGKRTKESVRFRTTTSHHFS